MVSSLKGLSAAKNEAQNECTMLKKQVRNYEMQVKVLQSEIGTATDFLLEQEQKVQEVTNLQNRLAEKEEQLACIQR